MLINPKVYLIGLLVVALVWAFNQLSAAGKIAKNKIIIDFVNKLTDEELIKNQIKSEQLIEIRWQLSQNGNSYFTGTVRQAISIAISERLKFMKQESKITMTEIDGMKGVEFELYLKSFFEGKGFQVKLTKGSGDHGVDLILNQGGRKIAMQAKRYSPNHGVGNSAIQEVFSGKEFYDCNEGCVITTTHFTNQAMVLANKVGIRLIDRQGIINMVEKKYLHSLRNLTF
ncbi:restriction endonuclease [Paenibacillus aestuarii]|uniref:Restriction endonuclease n=1 Tax=Paenibacillus aestuarii TaxID=516965 RepID=A0ABW0K886_9BACL